MVKFVWIKMVKLFFFFLKIAENNNVHFISFFNMLVKQPLTWTFFLTYWIERVDTGLVTRNMLLMMTSQPALSSCQNFPTNNLQPKVTIIWLLLVPEQDWLKKLTSYLSFLLHMLFSQGIVIFRLKAEIEFRFWFWQFLCV